MRADGYWAVQCAVVLWDVQNERTSHPPLSAVACCNGAASCFALYLANRQDFVLHFSSGWPLLRDLETTSPQYYFQNPESVLPKKGHWNNWAFESQEGFALVCPWWQIFALFSQKFSTVPRRQNRRFSAKFNSSPQAMLISFSINLDEFKAEFFPAIVILLPAEKLNAWSKGHFKQISSVPKSLI